MNQQELNFDIKTFICETLTLINRLRNHVRTQPITAEQRETATREIAICLEITNENAIPRNPRP